MKKQRWISIAMIGLAVCAVLRLEGIAPETAEFDLDDTGLFPPEFFPGLHERSETELLLAGLRAVYPDRILVEPPRGELPEPVQPLVRPLGKNGSYIRILNLSSALPVIEQHLGREVLLLDFRFLATDLDSTVQLGSLLTRQAQIELQVAGDYPADRAGPDGRVRADGRRLRDANSAVFTLSNHETRGPIEALLDQLKIDGDIVSIGAPTAGRTAVFRQAPGFPYYLMSGEIRAARGESLVEDGFVPRVTVSVAPDEDLIGYSSLRDNVTIDQVVQTRVAKTRFDEARLVRERVEPGLPETTTSETEPEAEEQPLDLILQRAVNIVKALQALGHVAG